jgi:citrate lyase beta subunit
MFRSWLCASALKTNLVHKAREVGADVAVIDLEDSVPADAKHAARLALHGHFQHAAHVRRAVRINSLATCAGLSDLLFLLDQKIAPDFIILPKANLPSEATLAATLLEERGMGSVSLFAIIETASSLYSLRTLTGRPDRLAGLMFGAADFAADLGVSLEDADLRFIQQEVVLAAARLGVHAVDSPCFALRDPSRVAREAREAQRLGFTGKIAIHPSQVGTINTLFTPSSQMLERARRLVDAALDDPSKAVFEDQDQMVGPPFIKYALRVLTDARRAS